MTTDRDSWLVIEPYSITDRELHPSEQDWALHATACL